MARYHNLGATWVEVDVKPDGPYGRGQRGDKVYAVDANYDHVCEWHCEPPPKGETYVVVDESWSSLRVEALDFTVVIETPWGERRFPREMPLRRIYRIHLARDMPGV
jgi:hypothetical protein